VEQKEFANRTLGVVSLLGSEQAKLIRKLLITEIGEDRIIRHGIQCGDAMTFQGNERDIIFISMIATAEILQAQTSRVFEQRYNVAASRARDRMYLFHSFQKDELKETDLRLRLLEHFYNPIPDNVVPPSESLRQLCETDFEREVFDALTSKGYRVLPKVRVGSYTVPLVVEGLADQRLAVACDGGLEQTLDKWNKAMTYQRVMERMGWTFWRCWASGFILDKAQCLNELFTTLRKLGIQPDKGYDLPTVMSLVEHRTMEVEV
jgi:very-short-patch-repair endonuclease